MDWWRSLRLFSRLVHFFPPWLWNRSLVQKVKKSLLNSYMAACLLARHTLQCTWCAPKIFSKLFMDGMVTQRINFQSIFHFSQVPWSWRGEEKRRQNGKCPSSQSLVRDRTFSRSFHFFFFSFAGLVEMRNLGAALCQAGSRKLNYYVFDFLFHFYFRICHPKHWKVPKICCVTKTKHPRLLTNDTCSK